MLIPPSLSSLLLLHVIPFLLSSAFLSHSLSLGFFPLVPMDSLGSLCAARKTCRTWECKDPLLLFDPPLPLLQLPLNEKPNLHHYHYYLVPSSKPEAAFPSRHSTGFPLFLQVLFATVEKRIKIPSKKHNDSLPSLIAKKGTHTAIGTRLDSSIRFQQIQWRQKKESTAAAVHSKRPYFTHFVSQVSKHSYFVPYLLSKLITAGRKKSFSRLPCRHWHSHWVADKTHPTNDTHTRTNSTGDFACVHSPVSIPLHGIMREGALTFKKLGENTK